MEISVADERRDPSLYAASSSDPRDRDFHFVRITSDPDYRTRRAAASMERTVGFGSVRLMLGYDRAWRTGGMGRNEWLGLVALRSRRLRTF